MSRLVVAMAVGILIGASVTRANAQFFWYMIGESNGAASGRARAASMEDQLIKCRADLDLAAKGK